VRYAAAGGPNQVVSASTSPVWVRSPTQATYPSGRTRTAAGAVTAPIAADDGVDAGRALDRMPATGLELDPAFIEAVEHPLALMR
jgi:hypothetical protein